MGCAALSPSYKWLFLSFSGHPEDKSLILKVFPVWGQRQKQQDNSGGTAKYQRHVPALRTVQCGVLYSICADYPFDKGYAKCSMPG